MTVERENDHKRKVKALYYSTFNDLFSPPCFSYETLHFNFAPGPANYVTDNRLWYVCWFKWFRKEENIYAENKKCNSRRKVLSKHKCKGSLLMVAGGKAKTMEMNTFKCGDKRTRKSSNINCNFL